MHTVKQVAAEAGVTIWALYKAHERGALAEPIRAGRSRIYTDDDRVRVIEYFTRHQKKQDVPCQARPA